MQGVSSLYLVRKYYSFMMLSAVPKILAKRSSCFIKKVG
jgi:hypothetical protein